MTAPPQTTLAAATLLQAKPNCLPVVDPQFKQLGRVWLDPQRVQPTKALERWQARPAQAPFLCQLHGAGRCTAGEACNQVHADPTYIAAVRELLSQMPVVNCCPSHGDLASLREDFQAMMLNHPLELRPGCIDPIPVPRECLAITKYW
eukprot:EG_transcript_41950